MLTKLHHPARLPEIIHTWKICAIDTLESLHGAALEPRTSNMSSLHRAAFAQVVTPNMYNLALWHTSGHAAKYKENMFLLDIEGQEFGLKPMNCPGEFHF
eukprot:scaffold43720_cov30-Tisochrysis_lutea.AAC.4